MQEGCLLLGVLRSSATQLWYFTLGDEPPLEHAQNTLWNCWMYQKLGFVLCSPTEGPTWGGGIS